MLWKCCQKLRIEEITTSKDQRCEVGEAPHWDIKTQSLFYVDISRAEILRYDKRKNRLFKAKIKDNILPVSFIVPVEDKKDEFVVSMGLKICVIRWDGKSHEANILEVLTEVDHDRIGNRCNDGKVDPSGKFLYFGTMGDESKYDLKVHRDGSFYRYSEKGGTNILKYNVGISNGLTWDSKRRKFFYIDSMERNIKQFHFEPITSELCKLFFLSILKVQFFNQFIIFPKANERTLINFNQTHKFIDFIADGMTIDSKGFLYVAAFGASRIFIINPKKQKIVNEIELPTSQVTSLAFGGKNLKTLFVTTADKDRNLHGSAGGLFRINGLGRRGLSMNNFKRN